MLGDGADPESVEAAMEAYRHFGIQDSAKYDFFPGNSITVSDSLFPNGHERIPFVLDKRIPIGGGKTLPLYWCAPFPFKVRLKWTEPREITQIFITSKGERCPAEISYSGPNEPIAAPLPVVHQEFSENERLHETRYISRPTLANEILLVFQGEKGKHGYITDVSIPDRADFEWVETTLHVVGSEQSVEGFPTRLSFGSPN